MTGHCFGGTPTYVNVPRNARVLKRRAREYPRPRRNRIYSHNSFWTLTESRKIARLRVNVAVIKTHKREKKTSATNSLVSCYREELLSRRDLLLCATLRHAFSRGDKYSFQASAANQANPRARTAGTASRGERDNPFSLPASRRSTQRYRLPSRASAFSFYLYIPSLSRARRKGPSRRESAPPPAHSAAFAFLNS